MEKKNGKILTWVGRLALLLLALLVLFSFITLALGHSSWGVSDKDRYYMEMAYREASSALKDGEYPVGAVLVADGEIIAQAHNLTSSTQDRWRHAEMLAINDGLKKLGIEDFSQTNKKIVLYTTYEPCAMCEGFIIATRVPRVVVGKRKAFVKLLRENYLGHLWYRLGERSGIDEYEQDNLSNEYLWWNHLK